MGFLAFLEFCVLVLVHEEKPILELFWSERTVGKENVFLEVDLVVEIAYIAFFEDL